MDVLPPFASVYGGRVDGEISADKCGFEEYRSTNMWPWGHLAVGYALYSLQSRVVHRRAPRGPAVLWVALGTQFPDLVDKPLAWWLGVIPNGRSLTHSVFAAMLVISVVAWLSHGRDADVGGAFAVGYLSHLAADAIGPFLAERYERLAFLLWPVLPAVDYEIEGSVAAHLLELELNGQVMAELWLAGFVLALWAVDGFPGPRWLYRRLRGRSDPPADADGAPE